MEWRRKDGSPLLVRLAGETTSEDGAVVVVEDIEQRRRLDAQQCQVRKLDAVGQLAGGVAHNFNNLLTAMLGFARILEERHGADPEDAEALGEITDAARRAASLVRQLLVFSGRRKTSAEQVDATGACRAVCELMGGLLRADVKLTFNDGAHRHARPHRRHRARTGAGAPPAERPGRPSGWRIDRGGCRGGSGVAGRRPAPLARHRRAVAAGHGARHRTRHDAGNVGTTVRAVLHDTPSRTSSALDSQSCTASFARTAAP